jgi:hypothetical protein
MIPRNVTFAGARPICLGRTKLMQWNAVSTERL